MHLHLPSAGTGCVLCFLPLAMMLRMHLAILDLHTQRVQHSVDIEKEDGPRRRLPRAHNGLPTGPVGTLGHVEPLYKQVGGARGTAADEGV